MQPLNEDKIVGGDGGVKCCYTGYQIYFQLLKRSCHRRIKWKKKRQLGKFLRMSVENQNKKKLETRMQSSAKL